MKNQQHHDYRIPDNLQKMTARVRAEVAEFFSQHKPEDSVLVLDSTGVVATRHYAILSAIGRERLLRFKEIHVFSGGAFAIFGFLGLSAPGGARLSFEELQARQTERAFRRFHHKSTLGAFGALANLLRRRSVFGSSAPLYGMIEHTFASAHTQQAFAEFPPNVVIYLGQKGTQPIARLSNGPQCDEACKPLRALKLIDVIVPAVTVPIVYGRKDRQDRWFDPVYAGGYLGALKGACSSGAPTMVSTPWKHGKKNNIHFVNCFPERRQKLSMLADFARVVLNIPSHKWAQDIHAAFVRNQPHASLSVTPTAPN